MDRIYPRKFGCCCQTVKPGDDPMLVHVSGPVAVPADDILSDHCFPSVAIKGAARLRRSVKIWQCKETKRENRGETSYSYEDAWFNEPVKSPTAARNISNHPEK
jgi:hypothetical protein